MKMDGFEAAMSTANLRREHSPDYVLRNGGEIRHSLRIFASQRNSDSVGDLLTAFRTCRLHREVAKQSGLRGLKFLRPESILGVLTKNCLF